MERWKSLGVDSKVQKSTSNSGSLSSVHGDDDEPVAV